MADKDCITIFRKQAIELNLMTENEADEIEKASVERIQEAIQFAKESPLPRPEALYEDVYA